MLKKGNFYFVLLFFALQWATAQTPAKQRIDSYTTAAETAEQSILNAYHPVNIGPSVFSCRVTDVAVNPSDPTHFYVAYASGGLWETKSNGTRFEPLFDHESSMTIGDIEVDWSDGTIWVGTGEVNSSRSSYAGTGVFKSTDKGKTWQNVGLPESHHIGRIVLHPTDGKTAFVAVLGHLYTSNNERGVYRTMDSGASWERVLFVNDSTGCVDLTMDPNNADVLYAAMWDRQRTAWNFAGAGNGSGIYKSTDGGSTWALVSDEKSGFPFGEKVGRIGLAAGSKDGKTVLYACVDNQFPKEKKDKTQDEDNALKKDDFREMTVEAFMDLDDDQLDDYLKNNGFPKKYSAKSVKKQVKKGDLKPQALVDYLEDANADLFEIDYKEAEVYRSEDGGTTWQKTHEGTLELLNFSYGYYFSNIRCAANNPDKVYMLGYLILRSDDGGKTWNDINGDNVHVDHHALWINPDREGHLLNGNDGGLNLSYDDGQSWFKLNNPPVGQFYAVAVDEAKHYNVYGGTQDNGVWISPHDYKASDRWHQTGKYGYEMLLGGDGMQIQVDERNTDIVYTGFQFGHYYRIDRSTDDYESIQPKHELGERPLRFNWQSPILLSRFNQDILYFGANKLFRSMKQGDDWVAISDDLTTGGKKGNVPYGTLTTIAESPFRFGDLYVGSDDGLVHHSPDGGRTWENISEGLPQNLWVSRVEASNHDEDMVYVSLNAYRNDDFTAYVYLSENQGKTWRRIGLDLPNEPVNVIREDDKNPDLLYVGTDGGLYVSFDRGANFQRIGSDFPNVPVHDLALQKREGDLIVGTHGRSIYRLDVSPLQAMNSEVRQSEIHVFALKNKRFSSRWGEKEPYKETKEPFLPVTYFVKSAGAISYSIKTKDGLEIANGNLEAKNGLNEGEVELVLLEKAKSNYEKALSADLKKGEKPIKLKASETGKYYLQKGVYTLTLVKNSVETTAEFEVE